VKSKYLRTLFKDYPTLLDKYSDAVVLSAMLRATALVVEVEDFRASIKLLTYITDGLTDVLDLETPKARA